MAMQRLQLDRLREKRDLVDQVLQRRYATLHACVRCVCVFEGGLHITCCDVHPCKMRELEVV